MKSDYYRLLAKALDALPSGFPPTKGGYEILILKNLFTPEEARIASVLSGSMAPLSEISKACGYPENAVKEFLDALLEKRLIDSAPVNAIDKYCLKPFIVGFYEAQVETMDHELAHLIEHYFQDGGIVGLMKMAPPFHRTVPIQDHEKVDCFLPYDVLKPLIEGSTAFQLNDCICRKQQSLLDKRKCDFPLRTCLVLLPFEVEDLRNSITKDEALKLLDEAEEIGLVHTVSNVAEGVYYVCNCCGCCCGVLRGITQFGIKASVAKANYRVFWDEALCTGCGACGTRCQVKALTYNERPKVDSDVCIGCGLCVSSCSSGALLLYKKNENEITNPPQNLGDWNRMRMDNKVNPH